MISGRIKFYSLLLSAFGVGYSWLIYNLWYQTGSEHSSFTVCFIKNTTNIPCPSCGSTRSVLSILQRDFISALYFNPLGYLIFAALSIVPVWILFDLFLEKNTFWDFYHKMEIRLKKPYIAIPFLALLLINWIWNIYKGI